MVLQFLQGPIAVAIEGPIYHTVKNVGGIGEFFELQVICQGFFHQFLQLSIELCMASQHMVSCLW